MKWLFLAVVGLLGLALPTARANYLMLIVNVGEQTKLAANQSGAPGFGMAGISPSQPSSRRSYSPMGGAGMMGGSGQMGGNGYMGGQGGTGVVTKPSFQLIPLCIEVESYPTTLNLRQLEANQQPIKILDKWGNLQLLKSHGPIALASFYLTQSGTRAYPKVATRYLTERAKVFKDSKQPKAESVLDLAEWALSHGLLPKFEELMDKLALEEKTNPAVVAYVKVKAELAKPVPGMPTAPWFTERQKVCKTELKAPHYVLLHSLSDADQSEVTSRANRLEDHLHSYYYWFALRGQVLPVPRERLVAILAGTEEEVNYYHKGFSADGPIVADGFYGPRENVTVLSGRPLAKDYGMLEDFAKQYWTEPGMQRTNVLKGKLPRYTTPEQGYKQIHAAACALALRAMEDSSELAGITNDGSRQLLFASGLLPRNVVVPEWALFGMSSLFGTAPDTPWQTLGAANVYLLHLRELRRERKLEASGSLLIRQIVTDTYFRQAETTKDPDLRKKAEATAWALSYFLARKELPKLQAYFKELARMPRDLDLDEETLMGCFARAFDVWDPNKKAVDNRRLETLANKWVADTNATIVEGEDMFIIMKKQLAEAEKTLLKDATEGGNPASPNRGNPLSN